MSKRLDPKVRKKQLMQAAVKVAEACGYHKMTREDIAAYADVAVGTVSLYFGTMTQLRRSVMRHAIKTNNIPIIAQGLGNGDPHARKAPESVRKQAAASLVR